MHQASLSLTISQSLHKICPLHQWCHPAISSSNTLFSFCSFYRTCYKFSVLFITLSPQININRSNQFSSVSKSCLTLCDPMDSSTPCLPVHHQIPELAQTHVHRVCDAISSTVVPFSFCLESFPASGSFPMSWFFASGGQSIGNLTSALVLPMTIWDWFSLELTGLISFQSKGLWRVFSNTTV